MDENDLNHAAPEQPDPAAQGAEFQPEIEPEEGFIEGEAESIQADRPEPAALRLRRRRRPRRQWKFAQAFWTVTGVLSLIVNVILVVLLLALGRQLFSLKALVENQVLGGLYQNFILMDQAHIRTSIPVKAEVPAKFDLPLKTNTVVVLTEDTVLDNAKVARLTTGGLTIENAPATIVLPVGTRLPVALDLSVPVNQMIPVNLTVNVDIPLNKTDLHKPFVGLQEVVRPYYRMLSAMPGSWSDLICGAQPAPLCLWLFDRSGN